ncbi:MAG TPA: class I SAM-dependent methyltransferase [Stellaceae bacterium]|nr:class I SAM-dependent methyltransferase [Stellaceae bacterium]HEX3415609.1 class I SAM-dependent methyltransferase [Stellaceae bacterium]
MSVPDDGSAVMRHDWHSQSYVEEWIARDLQRDEERRTRLRKMLSVATFPPDAEISVLDVGGGYGVVTEEVLRAFPHGQLILQEYSQPMLDEARRRLAQQAGRVGYVHCDLRDPSWVDHVGGPFDLAVSAIAIHNLGELSAMAVCYRGIVRVLKPGALFLDYDLFDRFGGIVVHTRLLQEAGFARVDCVWQQSPVAIVAAYSGAAS